MIDKRRYVNRTAYMDFRNATDSLFERITHAELADSLGVSVASIRQARLSAGTNAHRSPPLNWEYAVIRLAERQILRHRQLIDQISTGK